MKSKLGQHVGLVQKKMMATATGPCNGLECITGPYFSIIVSICLLVTMFCRYKMAVYCAVMSYFSLHYCHMFFFSTSMHMKKIMLAICSSDIIEVKAATYPMTQHVFGGALEN